MSTILKALKKLEDDQRVAAPVSLADKIVTAHATPRRRSRSAVLIGVGAASGLLLALALLGGWLWLRETPPAVELTQSTVSVPAGKPVTMVPRAPEKPLPAAIDPKPSTAAPAQPAVIAAASPRSVPASQIVAAKPAVKPALRAPTGKKMTSQVPSMTKPPRGSSLQLVPAAPVAAAKPAVTPAFPAPAGQTLVSQTPPVTTPLRGSFPQEVTLAEQQIPPPGKQWSAPQLEVTDIFPPTAGEGRMAVVNGLPVMAGMLVEDALVEEILADRVLFTINRKTVSVPLNKGR
jgi:hypothetical protein